MLEEVRAAGRLQAKHEWVFEPPPLSVEHAWILEGYDEVGTDRQIGFGGAGPVPFSSIRTWIADEKLTPSEADLFRHVVRRLDAVYFEYQAERAERKG